MKSDQKVASPDAAAVKRENPQTPESTRVDPETLARWTDAVTDSLRRRASGAVVVTPELEQAYEELAVANEELRAQYEELLATRAIVEGEREMYRALFETAPVPYVITDTQGTITAANAAAAEV